jgi:hypothetical protein
MNVTPIAVNHTEIKLATGTTLFISYKTCVAAHIPGVGYIRTSTKHSATTSRHTNKWIGGAAKEMAQSELDELYRSI